MNKFNMQHAPDHDNESGQLDIFVFDKDSTDLAAKEDLSSLEFPLFSLSKRRDTRVREYSRGGKVLKIIPPVIGAANLFDKDLLIYAIAKLVQAKNRDPNARISRIVRFDTYAFLINTKRSTGGASYARIVDMCQRLRGTTIETNIRTTETERTRGFSMIDSYEVIRSTKDSKGALELEITISDWLYRQILAYEVLTLHPDYFSLTQSIERRLYELARKHCGDQPFWKINLDALREKCGSRQAHKFFVSDLKSIAASDTLPEYRFVIDDTGPERMAVFLTRDDKKLFFGLHKKGLLDWYAKIAPNKPITA